jgi:hypothetical protein
VREEDIGCGGMASKSRLMRHDESALPATQESRGRDNRTRVFAFGFRREDRVRGGRRRRCQK